MFPNQIIRGNLGSESTVDPQALTLPFNASNPHAAEYSYPLDRTQQSSSGGSTRHSIGGESLLPCDTQSESGNLYAAPNIARSGVPGDWGSCPASNWDFSPQYIMDSNHGQSLVPLPSEPQGSTDFPACYFHPQAPVLRQTVTPIFPQYPNINNPHPEFTNLNDRLSASDFPQSQNARSLRQPNNYKVEKPQRPQHSARRGKKAVVPSNRKASQPATTQVSGQPNPDSMTICSFYIWMTKKPGVMPTEHEMLCFSLLFGDSLESVRNWFLRNLLINQQDDDTGYQTMTGSTRDISSACRRRRSHCNRRASKLRGEEAGNVHIRREEARPYTCTSRCGKNFGKKAGWKRHEETNHPPKGWVCHFQRCQNKRNRVYFRRDKFGSHLCKGHPTLSVTKAMIDSCCVPITSNFSKSCIFYNCDKEFETWKERIDHVGKHFKNDRWDASQWRRADEETEEDDDADGSEYEDSEDSDFSSDEYDSEDSGRNSGHMHSENGRQAGPGPYDRGPGPSRGHQNREPQGRSHGGAPKTCRQYQLNFSIHSPVPNAPDGMTAWCNQSNLQTAEEDVISSETVTVPCTQTMITDSKSTRPRPLVEVVVGPLGRGSRASVDEVQVQGYRGTVARKVIRHDLVRDQRELCREAKIMARFDHPHISFLIADFNDAKSTTLLLSPVADCNLLQYLNGHSLGLSTGDKVRDWFSCLSAGLHHMHEKGVRHRDIKPSNILVKNGGLLYTDFGSSNSVADEESVGSESADFTEQYAAPEVYRGERGRAADVWSLGCVFHDMVTYLLRHPVRDARLDVRQTQDSTRPSALHVRSWQWIAEWNQTLRLEAASSSASPYVSLILDNCEAMTRLRPEARPTAASISEEFEPRSCCNEEPKTGLGKSPAPTILPERHTRHEEYDVPHLMPDLVNSSEVSTLNDSSSEVNTLSDSNSFHAELIIEGNPFRGARDPWSGRLKSVAKVASSANTYRLPLDTKKPCEGSYQLQRFLQQHDRFQELLVTGQSRFEPRTAPKKANHMGTVVELTECEAPRGKPRRKLEPRTGPKKADHMEPAVESAECEASNGKTRRQLEPRTGSKKADRMKTALRGKTHRQQLDIRSNSLPGLQDNV